MTITRSQGGLLDSGEVMGSDQSGVCSVATREVNKNDNSDNEGSDNDDHSDVK
eukprot:Pgem_evm1s2945